MSEKKLQGFSRDVLVYGIGDGLGRMIGLIMLPILSRIFGPADYGAIELLSVGYAFMYMLMQLSVSSGVQRYYYRTEGDERRRLVTSCMVYLIGLNVLASAALYGGAGWLAEWIDGPPDVVERSIRLLAFCLTVEQTFGYLVLLLRLNRRAMTFSMVNVALVVLTPTLTFVFVVARDSGFPGVFVAKLVALIVVALALFVLNRREFSLAADFGVFRRVFLFAIPGHPALLVTSVMNVVPRYLLAAFAPISAVGLLSIAIKLGSVMRVVMEAFNRAWNPFAYKNEGSSDEARIYDVVFRATFGGVMIIASGLSLFTPEALRLLTPEEYHAAWLLAPPVILSLGLDGLIRIFSTILYTRDRVAWSTYLGLGRLALFLALGFLLVPRHQAMGLTVSLALTSLLHAIAYAAAARRLFPLSLHGAATGGVLLTSAVVVAFGLWVEGSAVLLVAVKLGLVAGLAFLISRVLLSAGEREKIRGLLLGRMTR